MLDIQPHQPLLKQSPPIPTKSPSCITVVLITSDGYGQGLAFPGYECAAAQLDAVQAVVVALVGALGAGEGEGDSGCERRQRLAHSAVGAAEAQLEGGPWVLLLGDAGDVKAVALDDRAHGGLRRRVVPVLGSQQLH